MTQFGQFVLEGRQVPIRLDQEGNPCWTASLVESPSVAFSGPDAQAALTELARFVRTRARYADLHGF